MVVRAGATAVVSAADGSSGAIIALHDGHEGEQAEITKDGFGGNDFIDLSNIVGAGGNMTVQQVGEPSTRKGDPEFMQHLNVAWKKASAQTKTSLKNCVHINGTGTVVRIDAIKDHPELEKFVRTFADGKTYIGVGAWGGSPGTGSDNAQSSAAHGNKDIIVTYSDGDATPTPTPQLAHRITSKAVIQSAAEPNHGGPGIILTNKSSRETAYFFYDNYWNSDGTAGANFDHPLKSIKLKPGTSSFISLPERFKGRVQRGTFIPATWVEFQIKASNDGAAHGDVSLEQGCDGAATIASTDGTKRLNGFTHDIIKDAPAAAMVKRQDGVQVLASTMGNWMAGPNHAAIDYENKVVGQKRAYISGGTGTDDVASHNNCFAVDMY
ncbi:hypothetical protein AOQ84DRAFT_223998 [Glonium stellatum]|uniref:Uncharacterized protein n=1 Tax=Glonium stellatum TaxID=574774 RepID=A0A8E2EWN7_9PEZI|nr:hypothetical protein AOQ84DRAFT_223998 [Glonium stellatum]